MYLQSKAVCFSFRWKQMTQCGIFQSEKVSPAAEVTFKNKRHNSFTANCLNLNECHRFYPNQDETGCKPLCTTKRCQEGRQMRKGLLCIRKDFAWGCQRVGGTSGLYVNDVRQIVDLRDENRLPIGTLLHALMRQPSKGRMQPTVGFKMYFLMCVCMKQSQNFKRRWRKPALCPSVWRTSLSDSYLQFILCNTIKPLTDTQLQH